MLETGTAVQEGAMRASLMRLLFGLAIFAASPGVVGAATPTAGEATPSPDAIATYVGLFAEGMVQQPSDIAISPDGSVWVTDMATDQLYQFDAGGKLVRTFGETGQGDGQFEFADYGAVGLDGHGNVYVLDTGNERVQKFTPDLTFTLAWGKNGSANGEFLHPTDIAVEEDGSSFVVDAHSGRLQQFDASGAYIQDIVPSDLADQFFEPGRLGLDSDGNLYVPDLTRTYVFDSAGHQIRAIQTNEINNGEVWVGNGAAVSKTDFLYVSDWQSSRIAVFDPDDVFVGYLGGPGTGPGQFSEVDTLVIDGAGQLMVLDFGNRRIQVFTLVEPSGGTPVAAR
jgi:DNA-binding beta-propeller fold protein YncE